MSGDGERYRVGVPMRGAARGKYRRSKRQWRPRGSQGKVGAFQAGFVYLHVARAAREYVKEDKGRVMYQM